MPETLPLDWLSAYPWAQTLVAGMLVVAVAWLVHAIVRRWLLRLAGRLMRRLPAAWGIGEGLDEVLRRLAPVVPVLIISRGVLLVPHLEPIAVDFIQRVMAATAAVLVARAIAALLETLHGVYNRHPIARGRPIKGYVQVIKLLLYIITAVIAIAALADRSPWFFISGLGAMTAILMLIFRDTILSLVAGIQLINNDLVRVGDWIEMPQFDADGDVVDISLNVVRVQNWDRTIAVIPTHKFLEHSFRNWRGMFDSGGRRIKRAIHIDIASVRFLTDEEIDRFRHFLLLRDYIAAKEREIAEWNAANCPENAREIAPNARRLTNIGTLRAYVTEYLRRHPHIHKGQTLMVRQLAPGPKGVGLEIYAFTNDTRWVNYEGIQGDIFDHIMAIVPEFGLRVFQEPAGHDFSAFAARALPGAVESLPAPADRRTASDLKRAT